MSRKADKTDKAEVAVPWLLTNTFQAIVTKLSDKSEICIGYVVKGQ